MEWEGVRGLVNIEVVIITKDEELNLPHALESLRGWTHRVWIVDSGSVDRTLAIAAEEGCEIRRQSWLGYARQKNWALDTLPLDADWVLILDADEAVTPDLRQALVEIAARPVEAVRQAGFYVNRHFIFMGGVIRHSGYYPSWNLRFFKRGKARYEEREVHEHMIVDGPTGFIHHDLVHWDRRSLEHHIAKHNHYSTLEARAIFAQEQVAQEGLAPQLVGDPLSRRRWIKRYVYPWIPFKFLARFVFMYVLRLGFLDGLAGFRFALFISSYELHIELKLAELRMRARSTSPD